MVLEPMGLAGPEKLDSLRLPWHSGVVQRAPAGAAAIASNHGAMLCWSARYSYATEPGAKPTWRRSWAGCLAALARGLSLVSVEALNR